MALRQFLSAPNDISGIELVKRENISPDRLSVAPVVYSPQTDIEFITPSASGKGFEVYPNLEERCEKKISKYLLGHEDALASTPGKLGSNEAIEDALKEIETVDVRAFEHKMNSIIIPKIQKLGIQIPLGRTFKFKNDKEKQEIREKQDASNKITAEIAKTLNDLFKAFFNLRVLPIKIGFVLRAKYFFFGYL